MKNLVNQLRKGGMKYNLINLLTLFIVLISGTACDRLNERIDGKGEYVSQTYNINTIDELDVSSFADVFISKGETALRIEGQSNILTELNVTDNNGRLEIGKRNNFGNIKPLQIYLSTPNLESIAVSGDVDITSTDSFEGSFFKLDISGISKVDIELIFDEIQTTISGEANLILEGAATEHDINISGLADIEAFELLTDETYLDSSGSSTLEVYVKNILDVNISGESTVYYKGNPSISQNISGEGSLISRN